MRSMARLTTSRNVCTELGREISMTFFSGSGPAIDRMSPDYIECQVMNRVLRSGPSPRLFRNLREEKGYTYGIGSGFSASKVLNFFAANTDRKSTRLNSSH